MPYQGQSVRQNYIEICERHANIVSTGSEF
jgi:hypothetical protein